MGSVLFFSGAGLSADSGLGVFRTANGIWEQYDARKVCNYANWLENYHIVHEFFNMRRVQYEKAEPNPMHIVIGRLQQKYGAKKVKIVTQNVDNLLEQAGCTDVLHVHRRIQYVHCFSCKHEIEVKGEFKGGKCEKCGGEIFKPSVVFFREFAPAYRPMCRVFDTLTKNDLLAVIGTHGSVVPIDFIVGDRNDGLPAKRLLCNLEKSPHINENNFDMVYHTEAKNAAEIIEAEAEKILGNAYE